MGALFIFILISVLVVSALLFFNKGEKAQEIKNVLKDIYINSKELFSNFKKLFLILKEPIQSKLNTTPTQKEDESPSAELETSSNDTNMDSTPSETDVATIPEIFSVNEDETVSENSINEEIITDTKSESV